MEIPSLIHKVLVKCAPTTASENDKITQDCRLWYEKLVAKTAEKVKNGDQLTLIDKVVQQFDSWYVRLAIAMLYFVIIKFIQDLMSSGDSGDEEAYKD